MTTSKRSQSVIEESCIQAAEYRNIVVCSCAHRFELEISGSASDCNGTSQDFPRSGSSTMEVIKAHRESALDTVTLRVVGSRFC